ncbi:hypothetical protein DSO57_1005041 [Entomophthora muscae]|uniref:Uncharacterized protein n=1 Tax=Entomophthora muscae TaxID=34485 RepID=A0ACC2UGY8_9FUNG|nr:hypothetical protein DSO57_1005041 [Entomophthora muscae]
MFRSIILREISYVGKMTGVVSHPAPLPHLIELYGKTIKELNELPEKSFYRSSTMAITHERLNIIKSTNDVSEVVKKLGLQQIEELILEANDELKLVAEIKETKPWEDLQDRAPVGQWD